MREILLTSSVLILALFLLRWVFREKISRRVQYALWGLVLVRLLVPVSLPALDFSVLAMAEPVQESLSARLEAPAFTGPVFASPQPPRQAAAPAEASKPVPPGESGRPASKPSTETAPQVQLTQALELIWRIGAAGMAAWLLVSNLRFAAKLRRARTGLEIPGCKRRVYMVESGLASPCLFGVFRPAIYLTPSALQSEESLRHVLAHEETHARHLDPLWSLLRGVCLAAYWFNPLVWLAALASRTDCELACDEGAIRRLGEEERLAYGRTLLRLVPVRRTPGNPMLSATAMSSDKKRLRDRITRIAENRKSRKLALCAMALLTVVTCLATFAGCAETDGKAPEDPPDAGLTENTEPTKEDPPAVERRDGPLTGAELRYFNEQFFNGEYLNIRNQFLTSDYSSPEDIDLLELFYNGTGGEEDAMGEEEWAALEAAAGGEIYLDVTKTATARINEVLAQYTGLTLAETNQVGLEKFIYLPEYDAYYFAHGDTNYRGGDFFSAGAREDGQIRLYYEDPLDGGKCVTLREVGDGYQFVSNLPAEKPAIPTVYPAGEPLRTIPLAVPEDREHSPIGDTRSGNFQELLTGDDKSVTVNGHRIQSYRPVREDRYVYVAEVLSGEGEPWRARVLSREFGENFSISSFDNLFGWSGFCIYEYNNPEETHRSYYGVDEEGNWTGLFMLPYMDGQIIDLDGDGINELLCTNGADMAWLAYGKDGAIEHVDLVEALKEALPEEKIDFFGGVDPYERCLTVQTSLWVEREDGHRYGATPTRSLYFDGKNLLVYKPDKTAVDHLSPGVTGPDYVLDALRREMASAKDPEADDWRIVGLDGPHYESFDGLDVEIYRVACEFHAAAPEKVVLAGGTYMDEDGWYGSGYCRFAGFCLGNSENRLHSFYGEALNIEPGTEDFHKSVERALLDAGLLQPTPAQEVQAFWDGIKEDEALTLSLRTADGVGGGTYPNLGYNEPRDLISDYAWEALAESQLPALGHTGVLTLRAGSKTMVFYDAPQLVSCTADGGTSWYHVSYTGTDAFFGCEMFEWFRRWYDEAEWQALSSQTVIPDDGRSREELAQAWAEAYEGARLRLTDGSHMKTVYLDIRDVEVDTERSQESMPQYPGAKDVFLISYSAVFVPAGEPHWFMAGNTAEYEGGGAPAGALQWWRCAYLYQTEDGWRSDGAGTGP